MIFFFNNAHTEFQYSASLFFNVDESCSICLDKMVTDVYGAFTTTATHCGRNALVILQGLNYIQYIMQQVALWGYCLASLRSQVFDQAQICMQHGVPRASCE